MKRKLHILLIMTLSLACLTLLQAACLATSYYLDAVNGDDANPGTSSAPWKTLNRAYTWYSGTGAKVQEGDTVLFRDGNYGTFAENNINRNDWVTYKADAGHNPILTSIGINNGNQNSYLIFDGFNITNGVSIQYISYMKVLNSNIQKQPASVSGYYEPYFYPGSVAVWTEHTNHITIQGNDISNAYRGMRVLDATDWLIKNNTIHHLSEDGMSLPYVNNVIIEDNYIYDLRRFTTSMEIYGTKTGTFIPGEVVIMPGTDAVGMVLDYKNNYLRVYQTSQTNFHTYWHQDKSRYIVGQSGGATINPISEVDPKHCDLIQMDTSAAISGLVIRGNVLDRRRYVGKGTENGQGLKLVSSVGGLSCIIENNLVVSDGADLMQGLNCVINNNTFIGSSGIEVRSKESASVITEMHNNIIENFTPFTWEAYGVTVQNHGNNIFGNTPDIVIDPSTELVNYPVDSLFVDAANGDFRLAENSAAIDFGDPAYAPATDIDGNPRDALPDAGCYEYGASSPSPQPPVANAGPNQTITDKDKDGEEQVTLDGSGSKDPDGTIVSFIWSEGGLEIGTGMKPTVILSTGTHLITLAVTDNRGLTDTDTVTIKVLEGDKEFEELPTGCYNNVFNPTKGERALIIVQLQKQARVKVNLYNTRGNKIRELVDEEKEADVYKYYWYGKDDNGNVVGSGLYFVHIQAGDYKKTKKIVVVK